MALLDITPAVVEDLRAQLHAAGVGDPTIIKALGILQGVMKRAVVRGRIAANPVREIDKPRQTGVRRIDPLAPSSVEAIRALMKPYDATLVSVIAYAGLRPEEAINVEVRHIGDKTLYVPKRKSRSDRYVDLLPVLRNDLREWLAFAGIRSGLIFPRSTGKDWTVVDWRNWHRRAYRPAVAEAGVAGDMRAYRLRGSYGSLLLWEGRSTTYVANQLGHSVATLSKHYAGVIAELEAGAERVPANKAIREARAQRQSSRDSGT